MKIGRHNGELHICMDDGQPILGTDTHGDRGLISVWLDTLGMDSKELFRKFDEEESKSE